MMKNFSMNKVLGTIKKRNSMPAAASDSTTDIPAVVDPATEQPQDTAARCVVRLRHSLSPAGTGY